MTRIFTVVVVALALILTPAVVRATTIDECQAALTALRAQATSVTISGKDVDKAEKDRASLLDKIDQASLKLEQAKFCDAIQKLDDLQKKVDQLVKAGEINIDPLAGIIAQDLLDAAAGATTSISELSAQSGGKC